MAVLHLHYNAEAKEKRLN